MSSTNIIITVPFRLTAWILLVLSSAISVVSLIDERPSNNADEWDFELFWSVVLASIAGGVAMIMSIVHGAATLVQFQDVGVHEYVELAAVLVTVVAWIMVIPVVMNPDKELAIDATTLNIIDANLYFSCWWGFMASLALFVYHGGEALTSRNLSREWICLIIASLVSTMAASNRIDTNCSSTSTISTQTDGWCKDLRIAVSLATFSAACAATITIGLFLGERLAKYFKQWVLLMVAAVVLGLWVVLVALLTFKDGAAKQVGTLFFGIWISALLSLYICLQHLHALIHAGKHGDEDGRTVDDNEQKKYDEKFANHEMQADPSFPDIEMGQGGKSSTKKASPDKTWWKDDKDDAKDENEVVVNSKKERDEKEEVAEKAKERSRAQEPPNENDNTTIPKEDKSSELANSEKRGTSKTESFNTEGQNIEEVKSGNATKENATEEEEEEEEEEERKELDIADNDDEEETDKVKKDKILAEEKEQASATSDNEKQHNSQ